MSEDSISLDGASRIRVIDLFSGAGGLSLGWLKAGSPNQVELVAAVDNDPALKELYAWNFPSTQFLEYSFGDPMVGNGATNVLDALELEAGQVEVVLAAPPCQTFSAAGKRILNGDAGLVFHVSDIVRILRPKVVLIENVPEFRRAQDGRLLGRLRVSLSDAGYSTNVRYLNAASFGVPQVRSRCFT
ncbi:MAG: DNA cytosine methyltransferase, partial [Pseudomonadota bacterium]|nr:DNA cytosine methyltransferase [Pseudomonadota bacterium]